jgi:site-specific DNA-cytosine methylase
MTQQVEIKHFHLFCGLGGGARGFNKGNARVGSMEAAFRCLGGIDVDHASIRDFNRMAGVPGTAMDLFTRDQYLAFHGRPPPSDWREAGIEDIHRAAGNERPHIVFLSAPCKGFSGLLSETRSKTDKYQSLNQLTLRGMWLALEAWKNDPVELYVFENVPRIANRGRYLLDQIVGMLRQYGYAVAETTHDCGELGGLAQSRKRFLLVARHIEKVPPFLYEPEKRSLRAVGDILGRMPMPGASIGGAMHRVPSLQWKTWVRLAFVEAGSDWRSLNRLKVEDGKLSDYLIMPESSWQGAGAMGVNRWTEPVGTIQSQSRTGNGSFAIADPRVDGERHGPLGVIPWDKNARTVSGESFPTNGNFSVADPRVDGHPKSVQLGVRRWEDTAATVTGQGMPGQGPYSVADPRHDGSPKFNDKFRVVEWDKNGVAVTGANGASQCVSDPRMNDDTADTTHKNVFRVVKFDEAAGAISGGHGPSSGGQCVADPRPPEGAFTKFAISDWEGSTGTVIGGHGPSHGAYGVADPRPEWEKRYGNLHVASFEEHSKTVIAGGKGVQGGYLSVADPRILNRIKGDDYLTGGHYGVVPWDSPSGTVSGSAGHDNGRWSVADPRMPEMKDQLVAVIRALDGTWHRPFTTLELAALQSLVDPEEFLELDGLSDSSWRERIGNAVPPDAAAAIAGVMGTTLLLAWSGETFMLSNTPIWVRPIAIALSVQPQPGMR